MLAWLLHEAEHVAFFVGLVRASLLGAGLETVLQHAPANLMLSRTIAQQFVSFPHSSLFSHQLQPHPWCYALRNFKWAAVRCVPALCMTCWHPPVRLAGYGETAVFVSLSCRQPRASSKDACSGAASIDARHHSA
jgi:hypothetical protein